MRNDDLFNISKIIVAIGIIIFILSLIFPWTIFSVNVLGKEVSVEFYSWGAHTSGIEVEKSWQFYLFDSNIDVLMDYEETRLLAVTSFLLLLVFPLCLFSLLTAILLFYSLEKIFNWLTFTFGALAASLAFFIIHFQVGYFSIPEINELSNKFQYSLGLFLAILSIILFIISYIILDIVYKNQQFSSNNQRTMLTNKVDIFCPECGNKLQINSKFCNKCGYELEKE